MTDVTWRAPALSIVLDRERETLRARGSEAGSWLNGLLSVDLRGVAPGRGAYGLLLTKTGKIRTDVDVLGSSSDLVLGVGSGAGEAIRAVLDTHLVMEDVELEVADEVGWLRVIGRGASQLVHAFTGDGVMGNELVASGEVDWLGAGGVALAVRRDALERAATALLERARAKLEDDGDSPRSARLLDDQEWDELRLRYGFPRFGRDYGPDDNPHEASLDRRAVSWDKGCYLGQEVVCMQDMRGRVKRRLAVMRLETPSVPAKGTVVRAESATGLEVGSVTSAVASGGEVLAFARLAAPYFEKPAMLWVGDSPASIVPNPRP